MQETGRTIGSPGKSWLLTSGLLTAAAASGGRSFIRRLNHVGKLRGEELINRETEALEQLTGIICIARAFFLRHTNVIVGHEQLDVALKLHDAELSDSCKQLLAVITAN